MNHDVLRHTNPSVCLHSWLFVRVKLGVVKDCCLWGQEAEPAAIQFQRIEIPEGRIDDIGGELIPSDRDEFQRTVNELNAKYRALHGLAKPSLVAARYTATFQNGQFVDGSAELDIKHPHPEPAYLSLSSLGLAAENFRWKSNPSVTPEAGLLPSGETGVLVSKSDTLTFRWSLRATSDTDRGLQFQLSLPDATTSELILDFPIGLGPECVDAIITPIPGDSEAARDIVAKARWRVELGATHRTEVNVRPTPQEGGDAHLVMVRPTFDYRISTTGLEFRAILEIDLQRRPLRNLTMQVDPRLRIGTISLNGLPVSFAANASMPDQILIELPTLAAAGPNELSATGYAETRLDGLWRLPQVQLLDVLWRQGNATIDVVEPLQIGQFDLHDCAASRS